MAVKIYNLDWRSLDSNINEQEATINNFLNNKTVLAITAVNEFICCIYTATPPVAPYKVKIYKLLDKIANNSINNVENDIANFLSNKIIKQLINLDSGTILLIYT